MQKRALSKVTIVSIVISLLVIVSFLTFFLINREKPETPEIPPETPVFTGSINPYLLVVERKEIDIPARTASFSVRSGGLSNVSGVLFVFRDIYGRTESYRVDRPVYEFQPTEFVIRFSSVLDKLSNIYLYPIILAPTGEGIITPPVTTTTTRRTSGGGGGGGGGGGTQPTPTNNPPIADFIIKSNYGSKLVEVDASASIDTDGIIVNYLWNYGDGVTESGANKVTSVHTYSSYGSKSISLTVTDNGGATATTNKVALIEGCGDGVVQGANGEQCDGTNLGEKTTCNQVDSRYTGGTLACSNVCIYDVSGCTPPLTNRPPVASFTVTPDSGEAPLTVTLDASASYDPDEGDRIIEYIWDFGDGVTERGGNKIVLTHRYLSAGNYIITLRVIDMRLGEGTATKSVNVNPKCGNGVREGNEECDYGSGNSESCTLPPYSNPPGTCSYCSLSCELKSLTGPHCGDGVVQGANGEQCDGTNLGEKTTCNQVDSRYTGGTLACSNVCIYDVSGCTPPLTNRPPVASFTVTPDSGEAPLTVTLDASASYDEDGDPIINYIWNFGDGMSESGADKRITTHTYNQNGIYQILLSVDDRWNARGSTMRTLSLAPLCGNGRIDTGEECDDASQVALTCFALGYGEGSLACSQCKYDKSACNGLVGDYKFNNNFADSSLYLNTASQSGGVIFTNRIDNNDAVKFDGVNDFLIVSDNSNYLDFVKSEEHTWTFWIKRDSLNRNDGIISKGGGQIGQFATGYSILIDDNNKIRLDYYDGDPITSQGDISAGNWVHIAIVHKRINNLPYAEFYINGVLDSASPLQDDFIDDLNSNVLIGKAYTSVQDFPEYVYMKGGIDEVRIYRKALSSNEISAIYNSQKPGELDCSLVTAKWEWPQNTENELITILGYVSAQGTQCNGLDIVFRVYEYDSNGVSQPAIFQPENMPIGETGYAIMAWVTEWVDDSIDGGDGNPEYYFEAYIENRQNTKISSQKIKQDMITVTQMPGIVYYNSFDDEGADGVRRNGKGFYWDSTEYIDIDSSNSITNGNFSVALWLRREAFDYGTIYDEVLWKDTAGNCEDALYRLRVTTNTGITASYTDGMCDITANIPGLIQNQFQHFALVKSGAIIKTYLDGSKVSEFSSQTCPGFSSDYIAIGATNCPASNPTNYLRSSNIDEFRTYNRALEDNEILRMYRYRG